MKRLLTLTVLISCCFAAFGQQVDDSLRYAESIWSMQKKAVILEQMEMTEAQKSSFWPVYESYSNAIQYLEMEYIRLLNHSTDDLSERKTAMLMENLLMNELLLAKARKQYYRKFRKALTPTLANQFMQLDNSFRTMLRIQVQKDSPALVSSFNRIYSRN